LLLGRCLRSCCSSSADKLLPQSVFRQMILCLPSYYLLCARQQPLRAAIGPQAQGLAPLQVCSQTVISCFKPKHAVCTQKRHRYYVDISGHIRWRHPYTSVLGLSQELTHAIQIHLHVALSLRAAVGTEACKKRSEKSPSQKERLSESTLRPYARLIGVTMAQKSTCE
jgi:hypothetical protein